MPTRTSSGPGNTPGFNERLTTALTGAPDTPLVFLGNFEVEEQWARGEHTLPRLTARTAGAVVNHMDEFALLLAVGKDHVILKSRPDSEYLEYLAGLGLDLPRILVPAVQDPQHTVTQDALDDPALLSVLRGLASEGNRMAVHGVSGPEEDLAAVSGLPVAGPGHTVCKAVNSKVYSRKVAGELGLRQPRGWSCESLDELAAAFEAAGDLVDRGGRAVVKEAFGVSGKGISELGSERRRKRILDLIGRQARRGGGGRLAFVVEEWVDKKTELNYQFTISRDGTVHFDGVKEQLTERGVHRGHRMSPSLAPGLTGELTAAAGLLGERLAADGYFGVVGVDAMVDPDGGLYPVTEINARNNMSTYQLRLQERLIAPGRHAMARHYPLRLSTPLSFAETRKLLRGLLLEHPGGTGVLVNNFATVNAGFPNEGRPVDGRLYAVLIGGSAGELSALDTETTARLGARKDESQ
ncbi:ATP-grasp domain-containing protein [Streptomyces sodiiphilus]|uniref:ATP-grasp domain-containing protein n=1 Tax=Streptomyces sodiiphilus TaxID=226217 RepID=A0ABN2PRW1_9ACTN